MKRVMLIVPALALLAASVWAGEPAAPRGEDKKVYVATVSGMA